VPAIAVDERAVDRDGPLELIASMRRPDPPTRKIVKRTSAAVGLGSKRS